MSIQFRQGDVLIIGIDSIPEGTTAVPRENGQIVLAHGEATGHVHAIKEKSANFVGTAGHRYLEVKRPVSLTHQEHDAITIPAGKYRVVRQSEYSPEEIRSVAD